MRFRFALAVVVLQVGMLAYMGGEWELVLRTGRTILLRTAPIDPNDAMRGDYARLDYDISTVTREQCRDEVLKMFAPSGYVYSRQWRDTLVFATLKINDTGVAELVSVSDQRPDSGLFLRGRVESVNDHALRFRYGIEAFFMQQGTAQKLEDTRRNDRPGVPIDAEVAVSPAGLAVLKGYHWEPLGITTTFERAAFVPPGSPPSPAASATGQTRPRQQTPPPRQVIATVKVELKNYGPEEVAIVDLPEGGSFRLVPDARGQEIRYRWAGENQPPLPPVAGHVIVLKPGERHVTTIDLAQPKWFVTDTKAKPDRQAPMALREDTETWSASFRLEYTPPDRAAVQGLPHADLVRHGKLRSRAFNPTAGMD